MSPRTARKLTKTKRYMVVARSVKGRLLFEDDADRGLFLEILTQCMEEERIRLLGWCLLPRQAHLIFRAPMRRVSRIMKMLEGRYALVHNERHACKGALFGGRFVSVPLQTEGEFLQALRYMHRQPLEVGERIDGAWSSYIDYTNEGTGCLVSRQEAWDILGGPEGFVCLCEEEGAPPPAFPRFRVEDDQMLEVAQHALGDVDPSDVGMLSKSKRDEQIVKMRAAGLSARQISGLTSLGINIIYRAGS